MNENNKKLYDVEIIIKIYYFLKIINQKKYNNLNQ